MSLQYNKLTQANTRDINFMVHQHLSPPIFLIFRFSPSPIRLDPRRIFNNDTCQKRVVIPQ